MATKDCKLIGRQDLLQQYHEAWKKGCRIFGFYGMTKVGKTRLCSEFIDILKDTDESKIEKMVFDFKDISTYQEFEEILFLKFEINSTSSAVGRHKLMTHFKNFKNTKYIFVFESFEEAMPKANKDGSEPDKLDTKTLFDEIYVKIISSIMADSDCRNVYFCFTSCTWAKFTTTKKCLQDVPPLSKEESVALLKEVLEDKMGDDSCLETIAELCDGLPGSIYNVGTDMKQHDLSNEQIVDILIERKLKALSSEFLPSSLNIEDCVNGMVRKLSTEKLQDLKILASTPGIQNISLGAKAFDYKKEALFKFDVLIPLKYRCLVTADRKSNDISVHPVTQEFMKIHHASVSIKNKAIAEKVKSLIEEYCNKYETDQGRQMEYIDQLKDYRNQGFPESFVPVRRQSEPDRFNVTGTTYEGTRPNVNVTKGSGHTSAGIPRLNDLSPATSTEKEDKGFVFPNTNLQTSLEQKPSLKKDIVCCDSSMGFSNKTEMENATAFSLKSGSDKLVCCGQSDVIPNQPKRISEVKMNLGCSIEENDRISVTPERRLSEHVKRNNLSRSLSAQEKFSETKSNNLSRAMTVQENIVQLKRANLLRSDAFEEKSITAEEGEELKCNECSGHTQSGEDLKWDDCSGNTQPGGELKWDECSGNTQNITSDESIPRNSSCERNDSFSLEDNVNVEPSRCGHEHSEPPSMSGQILNSDLSSIQNSIDPPSVRPKIKSMQYQSSKDDGNSLKRLLFGQIDSSSFTTESMSTPSYNSNTYEKTSPKEAVENEHSFGTSLDINSLLSSNSETGSTECDTCTPSLNLESLLHTEDRNRNCCGRDSSLCGEKLPHFSLLCSASKHSQLPKVNCGKNEALMPAANTNKNESQSKIPLQSTGSRGPNRAEKLKMVLKNSEDQS